MKVGYFEEVMSSNLLENYEVVWFYHNLDMEVADFAERQEEVPNWKGAIVLVDGNKVIKLGYSWYEAIIKLVDMIDDEEKLEKVAKKLLEVLKE